MWRLLEELSSALAVRGVRGELTREAGVGDDELLLCAFRLLLMSLFR
jgi:hypothetical protein